MALTLAKDPVERPSDRTRTDVPRPRRRRRLATLLASGAATAVLGTLGAHYVNSRDNPDARTVAQFSVAPPAPRQVRGPSVIDPLDRPGQWQTVTGDSSGSCVFTAGGLRMRTDESSVHQCPGPEVSACPGLVKMELVEDNDEVTLTTVASQDFRPGARHRLRIDLRGQVATVTIGGDLLIKLRTGDGTVVEMAELYTP